MPSRPLARKKILHFSSTVAIPNGTLDFQIGQQEFQNSLPNDLEIMFLMPEGRTAATGGAPVSDWGWRLRVLDHNGTEINPRTFTGQLIDPQTRAWDWTKELPERRTGIVLPKHQGALQVFVDNVSGANLFVHLTIHCWVLEE